MCGFVVKGRRSAHHGQAQRQSQSGAAPPGSTGHHQPQSAPLEHVLVPWSDSDIKGLGTLFPESNGDDRQQYQPIAGGLDLDAEREELLMAPKGQGYALQAEFRRQMEERGQEEEDWEKKHCVTRETVRQKIARAAKAHQIEGMQASAECEEYLSHAVQVSRAHHTLRRKASNPTDKLALSLVAPPLCPPFAGVFAACSDTTRRERAAPCEASVPPARTYCPMRRSLCGAQRCRCQARADDYVDGQICAPAARALDGQRQRD